jgi:RHS repeat-associated protein
MLGDFSLRQEKPGIKVSVKPRMAQGSNTWSYAYDPFGRRTSKTADGATTSYLYDGGNVLAEALEGKTSTLLNGLGLDERYARTTSAGTDSYLTDQLGSTIALANGSGEPTTEYTYDPFGTTTSTGASSSNPYQFTGRENDEDGLQDNRARYYNSSTGTFISQDPLGIAGSGINLYQYAGSDPINASDPWGTTKEPTQTLGAGGEGCEAAVIEAEERGVPVSGQCGPHGEGPVDIGGTPWQPTPTNLEAPNGSGGWKHVACEAATPVGGKAGDVVSGVCGIDTPVGHIPGVPEVIKKIKGGGGHGKSVSGSSPGGVHSIGGSQRSGE